MESSPKPADKLAEADSEPREADYQRRSVAAEANQLHGKHLPPEEIGHVLVAGGSQESKKTAAGKISKETIDWQRVATMSRDQLLEISRSIEVNGTTLRKVYESHVIGENGLRRLVYEHMQAGNIQEALHHEILEHQADFERDPRLRQHSSMPDSLRVADEKVPAGASLDNLLAKAGLTKLDPERELGAPKILPEHGVPNRPHTATRRRVIDIALVIIILILAFLVVLLAINRRQ